MTEPKFPISEIPADDAEGIRQVQKIQVEHQIAQNLISKGETRAENGFLMASYSEGDFEKFLKDGGRIFVAKASARIVGYLLANPGSIIRRDYPNTVIHWVDDAAKKIYGRDYEDGRFSYLDQIGVAGENSGRGIGRALMESYLGTVHEPMVLSAVLREPLCNVRSHDFFEKAGYSIIGEFHTPELKGLKDVKSSVFCKRTGST